MLLIDSLVCSGLAHTRPLKMPRRGLDVATTQRGVVLQALWLKLTLFGLPFNKPEFVMEDLNDLRFGIIG